MTPITDEMVREFLENDLRGVKDIALERWSTFLASKQAKEWEIVSFKSRWDTKFELREGRYWGEELSYSLDGMLNYGNSVKNGEISIHSIRRLSDNEVFEVGERTLEGKIEKFEIRNNCLLVMIDTAPIPGYLHQLHKLPEQKPVFQVGFDDKPIFSGDQYFFLTKGFEIRSSYAGLNPVMLDIPSFSTRSAAEEYVRSNKPKYSENIIRDALMKHPRFELDVDLCMELIHQQIEKET